MSQTVKEKIVAKGGDYFEQAKAELILNGKTAKYRYLLGISEGLRIALSVLMEEQQSSSNKN